MIFAAALVEDDWIFGNVEGAVAESVFDVDENIGQFAVVDNKVSASLVPLQAGSWLMSILAGLGATPSIFAWPLTVPTVEGSMGVAEGAGVASFCSILLLS